MTSFVILVAVSNGWDVEGYQLRIAPQEGWHVEEWAREQLLLNPDSRCVMSSSPMIWPLAIPYEDWEDLENSDGLLDAENLDLAMSALQTENALVVFCRQIGECSLRAGSFNCAVPDGFTFCGFDVTNSSLGLSVISAQPFEPDEWRALRDIAGSEVNERNLINSGEIAARVAEKCSDLMPEEQPFFPVLYAVCQVREFAHE